MPNWNTLLLTLTKNGLKVNLHKSIQSKKAYKDMWNRKKKRNTQQK